MSEQARGCFMADTLAILGGFVIVMWRCVVVALNHLALSIISRSFLPPLGVLQSVAFLQHYEC
jgi:hypothetical protein